MNENAKTLLVEMSRGAQLTYTNAEELYAEGDLLRRNGSMNRALLLHQISLEECGKIEIIGVWAMNIFLGGDVDISKMTKAFRSHKTKNYVNAYYASRSPDEHDAITRGDTKSAVEAFKQFQKEFHGELNTNKNASLYVDFKNNRFSAPSEIISEEMVIEMKAINTYFLGLTGPKIESLDRMVNDDGFLQRTMEWFAERVANLKHQNLDNIDNLMEELIQEMFKKYLDEKDAT